MICLFLARAAQRLSQLLPGGLDRDAPHEQIRPCRHSLAECLSGAKKYGNFSKASIPKISGECYPLAAFSVLPGPRASKGELLSQGCVRAHKLAGARWAQTVNGWLVSSHLRYRAGPGMAQLARSGRRRTRGAAPAWTRWSASGLPTEAGSQRADTPEQTLSAPLFACTWACS
jgi:hypothetical protein